MGIIMFLMFLEWIILNGKLFFEKSSMYDRISFLLLISTLKVCFLSNCTQSGIYLSFFYFIINLVYV